MAFWNGSPGVALFLYMHILYTRLLCTLIISKLLLLLMLLYALMHVLYIRLLHALTMSKLVLLKSGVVPCLRDCGAFRLPLQQCGVVKAQLCKGVPRSR